MIALAALIAAAILAITSVGTFLGGYWYQLLRKGDDDE